MRVQEVGSPDSARSQPDPEVWRLAIEHAPVGIALSDLHGRLTFANATVTSLLGCDQASLLGRTLGHLWSREEARGDAEHFAALADGREETFSATRHLTRPDGQQLALRLRVSAAVSSTGGASFAVLHLSDVTDSDTAQVEETLRALQSRTAELKRSNEDLTYFAAVVSHDLRAPLAAIQGFSELLEDASDPNEPEQLREWRRRIASSAGRMGDLVASLLEYSRAAQRRGRDVIDAQALILDVVADLYREIRDSEADITWNDDLPVIRGEVVQLRRLLQNLLQNAMKYRRPDAPAVVRIDVETHDDGWLFRVADNGVGISDSAKREVFEMFHQQSNTDGYGIGLATCVRIVDEHGGEIWVEDNQPHGAVFCFTIADLD